MSDPSPHLPVDGPDGMPQGYQPHTSHGARVRADVVDVYVFARVPASDPLERGRARSREDEPGAWGEGSQAAPESAVCFLQLLRAGPPLDRTWQPVMGHVHAGETSVRCALREMDEELGLRVGDPALVGLWALEQVHPFYITAIDTIVMSPRFCCEVRWGWKPTLNEEHSAHRWVRHSDIDTHFMWPGQKACCREILREILSNTSLSRDGLRIALGEHPITDAAPRCSARPAWSGTPPHRSDPGWPRTPCD